MANYVATARSNVFRVKDAEAFLEWAETLPRVTAEAVHNAPDYFLLLMLEEDCDGWPTTRESEDSLDGEEFDLVSELADHLAAGSVAVLEEVGHEKLRYLVGYAVAGGDIRFPRRGVREGGGRRMGDGYSSGRLLGAAR